METIRKKGLEIEIQKHSNKIPEVQEIVNRILEKGLSISREDIISLRGGGDTLKKQAEKLAKTEASKFKLLFRRQEEEKHITDVMLKKIYECTGLLNNALPYPLEEEAYDIKNGEVCLSADWLKGKEDQYTIYPTESREQALQLIDNLEKAIQDVNNFVKNNPAFGKGFTVWNDGRRALCWLDDNGNFQRNNEDLEYV